MMSDMAYENSPRPAKESELLAATRPQESPLLSRPSSRAPALRLLHGEGTSYAEPLRSQAVCGPSLRAVDSPTRVLLAGSDAGRRATLREELSRTLPQSTVFEHADAVCDALEQAPHSRMAFITGDLDDARAESLMQTLAHRHPGLPVVVLDSPEGANDGPFAGRRELQLQHG